MGAAARTVGEVPTWAAKCVCCRTLTKHRHNSTPICEECDTAFGSIPVPTMSRDGATPELVAEVKARWEAGWTVRIRPDLSGWEWIPPTVVP